jgi:hypothetical protein
MALSEIFKQMWQVTKTPLLVYATDDALDEELIPLPQSLKVLGVAHFSGSNS